MLFCSTEYIKIKCKLRPLYCCFSSSNCINNIFLNEIDIFRLEGLALAIIRQKQALI